MNEKKYQISAIRKTATKISKLMSGGWRKSKPLCQKPGVPCWTPVLVYFLLRWSSPRPTTWVGKGLFRLQLTVHYEMKSVQKFKAGAEAEAMKQCWVLAYSSWLVQTAFLYHSEPCAQVAPLIVGCTHVQRWPIEKMSHRLAYRPMCQKCFLKWGILF